MGRASRRGRQKPEHQAIQPAPEVLKTVTPTEDRAGKTEVLVWVLVLGAVAGGLAMLTRLPAEPGRVTMGKAVQDTGTWWVKEPEPDGVSRWGRPELAVRDGDRIETLTQSGARIVLNDGATLVADEDTKATLKMEDGVRTLDLAQGRVVLTVKETPGDAVIRTPKGNLRLIGATEAQVRTRGTQAEAIVAWGLLEATPTGSGKSVTVKAGEMASLIGGEVKTEKLQPEMLIGQLWWSRGVGAQLPEKASGETGGIKKP